MIIGIDNLFISFVHFMYKHKAQEFSTAVMLIKKNFYHFSSYKVIITTESIKCPIKTQNLSFKSFKIWPNEKLNRNFPPKYSILVSPKFYKIKMKEFWAFQKVSILLGYYFYKKSVPVVDVIKLFLEEM